MNLSKKDELEILRYMGMPREKAEEEIIKQVHALYDRLEKCIQPKFIYRCFDMNCQEGIVEFLGTSLKVASKDLTKLLETSNKCYVMAATLGPQVDQLIRRLQKTDMLEAVIVNACSALRIEKLCDEAEKEIMEQIDPNQYLTMRYSPGYGDVPITLQRQVLDILDASKRIGLTTTKASMLIPSKSVTAFIGISATKQNRMKSCHICHLKETCIYRKRGDRCGTT